VFSGDQRQHDAAANLSSSPPSAPQAISDFFKKKTSFDRGRIQGGFMLENIHQSAHTAA